MTCYILKIKQKTAGHICGDIGEHCAECDAPSDNLCDFPVGDGKTCDRPICDEHSRRIGVDIHYCQTHARHWDKWRRGGGVKDELENVVPFKGV